MLLVILILNDHVDRIVSFHVLKCLLEHPCWVQIVGEKEFEIDYTQLKPIFVTWRLPVKDKLENYEAEFFGDEGVVDNDVWNTRYYTIRQKQLQEHVHEAFWIVEIRLLFPEIEPE